MAHNGSNGSFLQTMAFNAVNDDFIASKFLEINRDFDCSVNKISREALHLLKEKLFYASYAGGFDSAIKEISGTYCYLKSGRLNPALKLKIDLENGKNIRHNAVIIIDGRTGEINIAHAEPEKAKKAGFAIGRESLRNGYKSIIIDSSLKYFIEEIIYKSVKENSEISLSSLINRFFVLLKKIPSYCV